MYAAFVRSTGKPKCTLSTVANLNAEDHCVKIVPMNPRAQYALLLRFWRTKRFGQHIGPDD